MWGDGSREHAGLKKTVLKPHLKPQTKISTLLKMKKHMMCGYRSTHISFDHNYLNTPCIF